jgi:hypothetical protein
MNERLKELVKQRAWHAGGGIVSDLAVDVIAELIVRECVNVLDKAQWDKGEDWVCADGTRIIPQIREHFGVKE